MKGDFKLTPPGRPSIADRAYFAGFFDGEGCVQIYGTKASPIPQLKVSLTQTWRPVLDQAVALFGGRIHETSGENQARRKDGGLRRTKYHWYACGKIAAAFLAAVEPFLKVKVAEAVVARQFWAYRQIYKEDTSNRSLLRPLWSACQELHLLRKAPNAP